MRTGRASVPKSWSTLLLLESYMDSVDTKHGLRDIEHVATMQRRQEQRSITNALPSQPSFYHTFIWSTRAARECNGLILAPGACPCQPIHQCVVARHALHWWRATAQTLRARGRRPLTVPALL